MALRSPQEEVINDATKSGSSWQTRLESWPLVRPLLERLYEKRFSGNGYGAFRGVFANFEEASRSAPNNKPLGFGTQDYAEEFADRRSRIFSFDYPVMFWLAPLLQRPARLFDYGGHCGTHFYAYAQYIDYSPEMQWVVCDVPEIMQYGEKIAAEQGKKQLTFTGHFPDASGADVLLAAGSLQYVESPVFSKSLADLNSLPQHLLLNKLPLYDGPTIVTLQNGGVAFHPMYIFNRKDFIDSIDGLGYKLVDQWTVPSHAGRIPFHPESSFPAHCGLYFRLRD